MMNIKAQRGVSYWSIMFGIMLAVLVVKAALVIWPAYWDNRLINTSIKERLKNANDANPEAFMKALEQQFSLNNLRDVQAKDIMQVSNGGGGLVVDTDYEVRKKFVANVDMVVVFKKQFDQRLIKAGGK
ncbi:DUF4845 domain-containing protein [Alkanindiges sp. WGS2144]|uniref:DUF4845 domain-containing protein n=1 Tax=Alkanindiges sp. WGS2144 TaxID=3366808 RepID=UPI003753D3D3